MYDFCEIPYCGCKFLRLYSSQICSLVYHKGTFKGNIERFKRGLLMKIRQADKGPIDLRTTYNSVD